MNLKTSTAHLAALLILIAAALGCGGCTKHQPGPFFETAPVKRGNITEKITATGPLNAVGSVDVGSQISGCIKTVDADYNSSVKNGERVASIDPAYYQASVHECEAQVANAKAALVLAQLTAKRKGDLIAQHAATQVDLDKAVAELHQAEATLQNQQAVLERARVDLDHCQINSPIDGFVISRKVDVGQTVAASFNTPVLFTIVRDLTKMHIDASVSEADIGMTKENQEAEFSVDAFPNELFKGKVFQVRKAPITVNNVVTYDTVIDVDNPGQKLYPGMTADVSILVTHRQNVLKVPNAALRFTPAKDVKLDGVSDSPQDQESDRGRRFVYLLSSTPAEKRLKTAKVKIGVTDGRDSEILDGLKEGDKVVTSAVEPPK